MPGVHERTRCAEDGCSAGQVEALAIDIKTPGVTLTVNADTVLEGAYEGCSIAVNGVCLTVTKFDKQQFTVGVAPETLRVTNLG